MDKVWKIDRREFLRVTGLGGGGLMLGVYLPDRPWNPSPDAPLQPNVFVRVDETGPSRSGWARPTWARASAPACR